MSRKTIIQSILCIPLLSMFALSGRTQCTTANLNWDNLEYLVTTGSYSPWVTSSMALTQNFAFGVNRLTMAVSNSGSNWTLSGENTTHTGEGSSYGAGADVQFATTTSSARTITLTFDAEVSTFRLSLYDLDASQRVTVSASNALAVAQSVTLTRPAGGTVTIAGSPGTSPTGTANASSYANNTTTGTLNIDVAGPVKTIVLSFNNAAGDFWLSDISACVTGSFPATYWTASKPFSGQAAYALIVVDNNFYYVNTTTGVATFLFTDAGHTNMNSLAYDPVNGFVYYAYTLTGTPSNDKALKRYDVSTGAISTVLADVTTLGIPTFENGIEVGAGAFYNGSYYLGIEAHNTGVSTGRKSTIWRIDFNSSNVPYRASQVFALAADAGTTLIHDWGDIGLSNGVLFDFDAAASDPDYYHYNLQTGVATNFVPSGTNPSQTAINWNETVYNINGNIMTYNQNGTCGSATAITGTTGIRWGDAGEAFRPPVDFGDSPSTYDPAGSDPAVHQSSQATLRIGASINIEANKRGTTSTEDTYDDGISTVSILLSGVSNYLVSVNVYNNTGADATLTAWLDYNGNGVFNPSEGITQVVNTSASIQSKYLFWPGINTTLPNGSYTYLRVRLTSTANGMTTSNPTGFYANGEVEDYRVNVDNFPLANFLLNFDVKKASDKVVTNWSVNQEGDPVQYEVLRSTDANQWSAIGSIVGNLSTGVQAYMFVDEKPLFGTSYYRLKWETPNGEKKYSEIKSVTIQDLAELVSIAPNPVVDRATVNINHTGSQTTATVRVLGMMGNEMFNQKSLVRSGSNHVDIIVPESWPRGIYSVQVTVEGRTVSKKLLLVR